MVVFMRCELKNTLYYTYEQRAPNNTQSNPLIKARGLNLGLL